MHDTPSCLGLGIGLGLPSALSARQSRAESWARDSRVPSDMLYPFSIDSRHASEATVQLDGLVSYWSPMTDDGDELQSDDGEDYEQDMVASFSYLQLNLPEEEEDYEGNDELEEEAHLHQETCSSDPLQRSPPACLNLLSPKLAFLATAPTSQGPAAEETVSTALEWAWLVPMLGELGYSPLFSNLVLTISSIDASSKQPTSVEPTNARAPAMLHMPSIESIASSIAASDSDNDYVPSVATSSYQSDSKMARSHSLLSSFSVASFSTAASSVASTSKSVLDRKRPLPSRAISSSANATQVIKLRSRTYQRAIQGEVRAESNLTRRDTKMSVVSQKASILCASPSDDELECMVFEPMQRLPSPSMSSSPCCCNREADREQAATLSAQNSPTGAAALFEIWASAENAERQRKLQKQKPAAKSTRQAMPDVNAMRVQKWVSKMRKTTNLRPRTARSDARINELKAVVEPLAWAGGADASSIHRANLPEAVLEPSATAPRQIKGIEQVLQSMPSRQTTVPQRAQQSGHIWDFLG